MQSAEIATKPKQYAGLMWSSWVFLVAAAMWVALVGTEEPFLRFEVLEAASQLSVAPVVAVLLVAWVAVAIWAQQRALASVRLVLAIVVAAYFAIQAGMAPLGYLEDLHQIAEKAGAIPSGD